jgi:hypothetical protein
MKFYIKKIVSLNPDRYDFIETSKAHKDYKIYLSFCKEELKDFESWLMTEI